MILNLNYETALKAAVNAGVAIKLIYEGENYGIEIKADESPVTLADKKSSAIIAEFLNATHFPVIDEEHCCPGYDVRKTWKNLWLVDPMDGTKEFISGNGEFTVNIAFIESGKPLFGVIYAPVTGVLWWGGKATGSFKAESIFSWPGKAVLQDIATALQPEANESSLLKVAASRSHMDLRTSNFIGSIKDKFGEITFVSKGSSLKLCMIAEGETDIYPRFSRTMEWDTAAGHAIVLGTNGVLLNAETLEELAYNKADLANPSFFALSGGQKQKGWKYF